jgi:hypothetical protein
MPTLWVQVKSLIFFQDPGQSLANGLHLITSNHNVLFMVEQHKSHRGKCIFNP